MRRFSLLLFFALSLFMKATAQVGEYRSEFAIGGGAGMVMSQVGFMPEVPQLQHQGLIGGLAFRYTSEKYFNSICAVTAEVNYARVGWKEDILTPEDEPVINPVTGEAEQYERTLGYIQVPVLARLGWGRERSGVQAFFQVGPQVGFFLTSDVKKNYDYVSRNVKSRTSKVVNQEIMPIEKKVDYGIAGGIGVEFSQLDMGHIIVEGRYYYGLGDLYGNSKRDYFGRSNLTNIVVKLTYLFDLKKTNNPKIK